MQPEFTHAKIDFLDDVAGQYSYVGKGVLAAARFIVKAGYQYLYPELDVRTDLSHNLGLDSLADQTILCAAVIGVNYYNQLPSANPAQFFSYDRASSDAAETPSTTLQAAHAKRLKPRKKHARSPQNGRHQKH